MKRHNYFQRSFLVLISIFILSAVCAYGAEESITLTTYYPSPYGVYSEMRLYPKDNPTTPCQEGLMYYDQSDHRLMVCGQDAFGNYVWQPVSGLWTLSGTNLYPNDNNWNVGIGTNPPAGYKLYVNGNIGWSGTLLSGSVPWQRLTSFPAQCPAGQYVWDISTGACSAPPGGGGNITINGMDGPAFSIAAGSGISITDNPATDTVTISNTGGGGAPAISGELPCDLPKGAGSTKTCQISTTDDVCFLTKVFAADPGKDVNGFECKIRQSGSTWYLDVYQDGNSVYCAARCINF